MCVSRLGGTILERCGTVKDEFDIPANRAEGEYRVGQCVITEMIPWFF